MPSEFLLTGSAWQLIGDGVDPGIAEDLAALSGLTITFTSNIPRGTAVPIPGGTMYIGPRTAIVLSDGTISENGSTPGIGLLANDPALALAEPLKWQIRPGRTVIGGKPIRPRSWWFDAPPPSTTSMTLDETLVSGGSGLLGSRWVFDGDSITINQIATNGDATGQQDRERSWTSEFAFLSQGRINYVDNTAVAGHTSAQRLVAFDADVAPHNPDVVLLTVGTNDIGAAVSMALWLSNLDAYLAKCHAIGAKLVVGAIWPTDENTIVPGRTVTTATWNTALYTWAAANNVTIVPWNQLADPVTGGWPAGWSSDQIHPTLLDSYSQIGTFGWNFLKSKVGPAIAPDILQAFSAANLLTNGSFTAIGSVMAPPVSTSATGSTSSGTLAAGTYSYKVTGRNFFGESLPTAAFTATLAGAGHITVSASAAAFGTGVRVYRKGPADSNWLFVKDQDYSSGVATWSDDGTVTPGAAITGLDTSALPTGFFNFNGVKHAISGAWVFAEAGVGGNIVRLRKSASANSDAFVVNVTAGQVLQFSARMRAAANGATTVALLWQTGADGGGSSAGHIYAYSQIPTANVWRLAQLDTVTVPAGVASAYITFDTDSTIDYVDIAEVRLVVKP